MIFKRGFHIESKQNIIIVEDIVTTGGSINEIIELAEEYNANIIGIVSIVDRNDKLKIFKYPYETLLNFPAQSWNQNECPDWLQKIPVKKKRDEQSQKHREIPEKKKRDNGSTTRAPPRVFIIANAYFF